MPEVDFSWGLRCFFTFGVLLDHGRLAVMRHSICGRLDQSNKYPSLTLWVQKLHFFMPILESASKIISGISQGHSKPFYYVKAYLKGFQSSYRAHILCEELNLKIVATSKKFRGCTTSFSIWGCSRPLKFDLSLRWPRVTLSDLEWPRVTSSDFGSSKLEPRSKKFSWLNFLSQKLPILRLILESASKMILGISQGRWRPFRYLKAHWKGFQSSYRAHILYEQLKFNLLPPLKDFKVIWRRGLNVANCANRANCANLTILINIGPKCIKN